MTSDTSKPIIVGVDGSEESLRALRWDIDESRLRGLPLHVVNCWHYPPTPFSPYQPPLSHEDFERTATDIVDSCVADALGKESDVEYTTRIVEGHPSSVLVDLSADADMIVVGCRGRGGFVGLLIGSVSQHVAEHAHCPVVVIHDHRGDQ
jgi:nucleotide-binding universal stress UspA family protein